jgi:sigma-B regulation protein RsbU (phosphoserine phosphatase)
VASSADGELAYASAGHDPPLLYRTATDTLEELEATGPPLGVTSRAEFPTRRVAMRPGDVLVLTTDGVWEVQNPRGEIFGRDRLAALVREVAAHPAQEIIDSIKRRVTSFGESAIFRDDFSLVVVRMLPAAA